MKLSQILAIFVILTIARQARAKPMVSAIKNIQKALTARILKRLDDGQPLVEVARKMKAIEGMQPQINDMERRLGIMQSVEPVLENAIKTLQKVVDVRGMGKKLTLLREDPADSGATPSGKPTDIEIELSMKTTRQIVSLVTNSLTEVKRMSEQGHEGWKKVEIGWENFKADERKVSERMDQEVQDKVARYTSTVDSYCDSADMLFSGYMTVFGANAVCRTGLTFLIGSEMDSMLMDYRKEGEEVINHMVSRFQRSLNGMKQSYAIIFEHTPALVDTKMSELNGFVEVIDAAMSARGTPKQKEFQDKYLEDLTTLVNTLRNKSLADFDGPLAEELHGLGPRFRAMVYELAGVNDDEKKTWAEASA